MKGEINHVEIPVGDMQKAKTFFNEVFSWKELYQEFGPEYLLVNNPSNDYGVSIGLYVGKVPAEGVVPVIGVEDIEKTLEIVEKNGGKILEGKKLISMDIGYSGYFQDIFGTRWGLFARS